MQQVEKQVSSTALLKSIVGLPILCSLLVVVGYLVLRPHVSTHIVRHSGPDGAGYGSLSAFLLGSVALALLFFAVGGGMINTFLKRPEWLTMEKFSGIGIFCVGYGALAVGLTTLVLSAFMRRPGQAEQVFGLSVLGFVVGYGLSVTVYALTFPRAKLDSP